MAAAIWAKLPESWIAPQPILAYTYVRQYVPSLFFRLGTTAGERRVEAFKRGQTGYDSIQSFGSILSGRAKAA